MRLQREAIRIYYGPDEYLIGFTIHNEFTHCYRFPRGVTRPIGEELRFADLPPAVRAEVESILQQDY